MKKYLSVIIICFCLFAQPAKANTEKVAVAVFSSIAPAKTARHFKTLESYLAYMRIKAIKGVDSANAFYRNGFKMSVEKYTDYLPITGGTVTGAVTTEGMLFANTSVNGDVALFARNVSATGYGFSVQGGGSSRYIAHFLDYQGNSKMIVQGSGNVGIGTTTPGTRFHVASYEASNWLTTFDNTGTSGHKAYFGYNDGSSTTYGLFITGGRGVSNQADLAVANKFYVMGNGYVGVGTGSPNAALEVNGNIRTTSTSQYLLTNKIDVLSSSTGADLFGSTSNATISIGTGINSGQVKIGPSTGGITVLGSASSGNVGIGTTDPLGLLHVKGSDDGVRITGTSRSRINMETSSYNGWQMEISNTDGNQNAGDLGITEVGISNRFVIKKGGNVGIGTINPTQKLSVNGNIRAKKIIVETGWSDYVFNDDYKLRSLFSLESFIKQNKHLPEVPSAKEVEKNGISVGDNQALLLKKIEELTLYVIEMKKEIVELQDQNKKLTGEKRK